MRALMKKKDVAYLDLELNTTPKSTYAPDRIGFHRWTLDFLLRMDGAVYAVADYINFNGVRYPYDLSRVGGPWNNPLPFSFNDLLVLNLDIHTALYWAIPILEASRSMRRLIIRCIDDLCTLPFLFPFTELEHCLAEHPAVKTIFFYAGVEMITKFQREMPLLNFRGAVCYCIEGKFIQGLLR